MATIEQDRARILELVDELADGPRREVTSTALVEAMRQAGMSNSKGPNDLRVLIARGDLRRRIAAGTVYYRRSNR